MIGSSPSISLAHITTSDCSAVSDPPWLHLRGRRLLYDTWLWPLLLRLRLLSHSRRDRRRLAYFWPRHRPYQLLRRLHWLYRTCSQSYSHASDCGILSLLRLGSLASLVTLGHTLDGPLHPNTARMEYSIPARRQAKLLHAVDVVLSAWPRPRARDVCRVVGHILSCELALGSCAAPESLSNPTNSSHSSAYNDRIVGSDKALAELFLWKNDLRSMPPQLFVRHRRPSTTFSPPTPQTTRSGRSFPSPGTLPTGYKFYRRLSPTNAPGAAAFVE